MSEEDEDEFSWADIDDEDIIVRSVGMIALYRNPEGDVVIRQDGMVRYQHDNDDLVMTEW